MDATAGAGGYPPMGRLTEAGLPSRPANRPPDYLLQVDGPVGVRHPKGSVITDVSAWTVGAAALFVLAQNTGDSLLRWVVALGLLPYLGTPVWRWARTSRHRVPGTQSWPDGVQAFALLSVLARADGVTSDRLMALAGLPPVNGDRWLDRLRTEWAVHGGRRRHWLLGDEYTGLTVPGRERLDRMRAELERVASGTTVG